MTEYVTGSEIDQWTVLETLGSGNFGSVFKVARDGQIGAMKVCHDKQASAFARLTVEAECLPMFEHPSIPKLLSASLDADEPYFVMSLAAGTTLAKIIDNGNRKGRVLGQIEVAEIMASLLSAVEHIHKRGYVHRDIKDANVIVDVDSASASLVDFGFCKRDGLSDMRDPDSFWRAGAGRFSPPSKLLAPTRAVKKHDVFAVGVTAYLLLTGRYPWSAETLEGVEVLREQMESAPLVEVHLVNSLVSMELSRLISRLLSIEDIRRPGSTDALEQVVQLTERLKNSPVPVRPRRPAPIYPHVVRDQLHGDVRLTEAEYQVLNTKEMQRLRTIKQLGLTNLVYPGAEHSRLAHSIGCIHTAEVMLRAIEDIAGSRFDADVRSQIRLYALTHDYSHVVAGHTVEDQLGLYSRHDQNQDRFGRLVDSDSSDLGKLLSNWDIGREVIAYLNPAGDADRDGIVEQAVSGTIGADVLDYVNRDALNCGLDHRVDSAIFRQLRLYAKDSEQSQLLFSDISGKYGLRVDREFAVESLLLERYALFLKVYAHSAKIAADAVLGKALYLAQIDEEIYEWIGDDALISMLCSHHDDRVQYFGDKLRRRQLPRAVLRSPVFGSDQEMEISINDERERLRGKGYLDPDGRAKLEVEIAKRAKFMADDIYFYCSSQAPGYKRAELASIRPGQARPSSVPVKQSSAIARRHAGLWDIWVFVAGASRDQRLEVAAAAEEVLNIPNFIDQYRRQLLDIRV